MARHRQRRPGLSLSPVQIVQLALLAIAAVLALRAALIGLAATGAETRGAGALSRTAAMALARQGMTIDRAPPPALAIAAAALDRAPLDFTPLEAIGIDLAARVSPAAALPAMLAARARRPAALSVRTWLARYYLQTGDLTKAVGELGSLVVLGNPGAGEALVQLARLPKARPAIAAMLQRRPLFAPAFFKRAGAAGLPPEVLMQLADPRAGDGEIAGSNAIVASFVRAGDYRRAYLAWVVLLPEDAISKVAAVFDGAFEDIAAPAPFNWTLTSRPAARAAFATPSGLAVFVANQRPTLLAQQTLALAPGRYRLSSKATGPREDGATLEWQLTCLPPAAGGAAVTLSIASSDSATHTVETTFDVPAPCIGQRLSLMGGGGVTSPALATVENVRIDALNTTD